MEQLQPQQLQNRNQNDSTYNLREESLKNLQKFTLHNNFGQKFAQKKYKELEKNICHQLQPIKRFFIDNDWCYLIKPFPQFHFNCKNQINSRLSINKQIQYVKGALKNNFDLDIVKQYLQQDQKEKGFIRNHRNKSLILDGKLYYSHNREIKAFPIEINQQSNQINIKNIRNHHLLETVYISTEPIYQLFKFQQNIAIRTPRQIIIIDQTQTKNNSSQTITNTLKTFPTSYEIINSNINKYNGQHSLDISTYQKKQTFLSIINNFHESKQIKLQGFVNSHWRLSQQQIFLTSYNTMMIYDLREQKVNVMNKIDKLLFNRVYNSIWLKGRSNCSFYVFTCNSFDFNVFDLRKMDQKVVSWKHMCEESPPSVLQYFDQGNQFLLQDKPYDLNFLREIRSKTQNQKIAYFSSTQSLLVGLLDVYLSSIAVIWKQ